VVNWPISQEGFASFEKRLQGSGAQVLAVTLAPPLETARATRGERELSAWEQERVRVHYETGIASPSFGVAIDNSHQRPEQTAWQVLRLIERARLVEDAR
jgi:hypothetical protein